MRVNCWVSFPTCQIRFGFVAGLTHEPTQIKTVQCSRSMNVHIQCNCNLYIQFTFFLCTTEILPDCWCNSKWQTHFRTFGGNHELPKEKLFIRDIRFKIVDYSMYHGNVDVCKQMHVDVAPVAPQGCLKENKNGHNRTQRLFYPQSPPQHPGTSFCTWSVDRILSRQREGL